MSRKPRRDDPDFHEEVNSHIQLEADRLVAEGMDPDAALAQARRAFGNVTHSQERFYESRRWMWLDTLKRNIRQALTPDGRFLYYAQSRRFVLLMRRIHSALTAVRSWTATRR